MLRINKQDCFIAIWIFIFLYNFLLYAILDLSGISFAEKKRLSYYYFHKQNLNISQKIDYITIYINTAI